MVETQTEQWPDESGAEGRSGLYIGEGESYRYLRIFYDPRTKTWIDADTGKRMQIEVANPRTIGVITKRGHTSLFGFEAVGQIYRVLGMDHIANFYEQNHESYLLTTVSIGGEGRKDTRIILGRASQTTKKKGILGFGKKE